MKEITKEQIIGLASELGKLTAEKNEAYGNATQVTGAILTLLYPNGIPIDKYTEALITVRVLDKLMRIATKKDAFGEDPWKDIAGYGFLGALSNVPKEKEEEKDSSVLVKSIEKALSHRGTAAWRLAEMNIGIKEGTT